MKNFKTLILLMGSTFLFFSNQNVQAQDFGADVVSSYVWRGTQFGEGPHIQPYISTGKGGFEIGFQTNFLNNFTFMGNYTSTNSSTDRVEGRDDVPLVGQVDNMYNLSLAYEGSKFFVRASMNYASEALDELSGDAYEDRYYDEQVYLDLNASYSISPSVKLFTEFKNLTNQPLRYYQGIQSRTMQLEYYSFNWNVGLKIDL